MSAAALLAGLARAALVLALAPLCQGVVRKLTARLQSRRGPPLHQPYLDLLKLLGKEDLESGEAPRYQRLAAALALAVALAVTAVLPLGGFGPLDAAGDAVLLLYLLVLSGLATLLAGAAAGSTYALLGASREMMSMLALEPVLAMAVVVAAVHAGSLRLEDVLSGAAWTAWPPVSGAVALGAALLGLQAFVGRVPFDLAEAETELMGGPLAEYSGRKLALLQLAQMVKLVNCAALLVALFAPPAPGLPLLARFALSWAEVLALVVLVTVIAATHARYRIDQALRYYAGLLAAAGGAVALACFGL